MKSLFTGIYSKSASEPHNALYNALFSSATRTGLYLDTVPQGAAFPYCVYGLQSREIDRQMDDVHEDVSVYFNIYSQTSAVDALDKLILLLALYDNADISVAGHADLYMIRDVVVPVHDLSDDTRIWGYSVIYDVLLES